MRGIRLLAAAATAALFTVPAPAADWPQWRGPNRDGKSADMGLLKQWPKDGPRLDWKLNSMELVGGGYGSPAVIGDRMYLVGRDAESADGKEFCICLTVADGKQVWKTNLGNESRNFGGSDKGFGPHCTPTVDGDSIFVLGVLGDLICLTKTDGKIVWQKNLPKDFAGRIPQWGYSESVFVDGDQVVCSPGTGTGMVALSKKTGETAWQCKELKDPAGHSSIVATEVGGVRQYVQQTNTSGVGVRAKDGKLLWKVSNIRRSIAVIPTPVASDGYVFFTTGYGGGGESIKLTPDGEGTKAEKVFANRIFGSHHGGVIQIGDFVYGHSESRNEQPWADNWLCMSFKKEGEPNWKHRGVGKGSICYADGHFYCYAERDGTLALVKENPEKYEEVSRFKIPETSKTRKGGTAVWPHPVIANGKLFLRDYEILYCYDVKASQN